MIWEEILPRLFFGKTKNLSPTVGTLSTMPIKVDGMGLLNPVTSAKEKLLESTNTAPSNLKYYISMKGIAFTYHIACITDP